MSTTPMMILDGGMSRELEQLGAPFRQPEWSALALIETPHLVQQVHEAFIQSGAEVILTNSYAVVPFHIGETRFKAEGHTLAARAGQMARQAVDHTQSTTLVAGSLPPLFGSYRPDLYDTNRADEVAAPLIQGQAPYVDLWVLETQSLIQESLDVINAIDCHTTTPKPIWVSFTLEDEATMETPCIRSGESVRDAVQRVASLPHVEAVLFNCCQPEVIAQALKVTKVTLDAMNAADVRFGAYANAFKTAQSASDATANETLDEIREDMTPPAYVLWAKQWQAIGASIIGGCCGIGVTHIKALARHLK